MSKPIANLPRSSGFGLVEILVGLAVGLITILVITQVLTGFEGQKRTTSSSGNAQTNGALALYSIEHDVRMAGYGAVGADSMLCPLGINVSYNGVVSNAKSMMPVSIVNGAAGAPDSLTVFRSSAPQSAMPVAVDFEQDLLLVPPKIRPGLSAGLKNGDVVVLADAGGGSVCSILQMTDDATTDASGGTAGHPMTLSSGPSYPYNPPNFLQSYSPVPSYGAKDLIINMGRLIYRQYAVVNNTLVVSNPLVGGAADNVATQVVDLQARYGVTDIGGQVVTSWVDASGEWAAPDEAHLKRIRAVRVGIIARSTQMDNAYTSPATIAHWTGGPSYTVPVAALNYRYKVFETVMPIRNVIWAKPI